MPPQPHPVRNRIFLALAGLLFGLYLNPAVAGEIAGYRTATFGMSESEAYDAIMADFGVARDKVARTTHALEKTVILTAFVDNLVYGTGRTEIAYILGYRSKALIQVNLVWRTPANAVGGKSRLLRAANAMIDRFALLGFPQSQIEPNSPLDDDATLLFRGQDKRGRLVLIGLKRPSESDGSSSAETSGDEGLWLRVSFIENAGAPDIFKIEPGQF